MYGKPKWQSIAVLAAFELGASMYLTIAAVLFIAILVLMKALNK